MLLSVGFYNARCYSGRSKEYTNIAVERVVLPAEFDYVWSENGEPVSERKRQNATKAVGVLRTGSRGSQPCVKSQRPAAVPVGSGCSTKSVKVSVKP